MIIGGIRDANSPRKSNSVRPSRASSDSRHRRRSRASSASTLRGVNERFTMRRAMSWLGGSLKIIEPRLPTMGDGEAAAGPGWMISSTVPRAEL